MLLITALAAQFHDVILTLHVPAATASFVTRRLSDLLPIYAPLLGLSLEEAEDAIVTCQLTPDGEDEAPVDTHYLGQLLEEGGAA